MNSVTLPAIGGLSIGGIFSLISVFYIRYRAPIVGVCFRGKKSIGRVTAIESGETARRRLRIAFVAEDGHEFEYLEPIAIRANVGDPINIRYNPRNPKTATSCPPARLAREFVAMTVLFGLGGFATLGAALFSLITGNERIFFGIEGPGLLAIIGLIFLYIAIQAFNTVRSWHRRVSVDGTVKRIRHRPGGDSEYPHPWIEYTTHDGQKVGYLDNQLTGYSPGETVTVYYDPQFPQFTSTSLDKQGSLSLATFFGIAGMLFMLASAWFVWSEWIKHT